MRVFRIIVFAVLLCAIISNASAFDTSGKFGMGIRFWGTPIITFSNMKFGLSDKMGLEPSFGYYSWKDDYGDGYESSNSIFLISVVGDINAVKAVRSNFMIKLGGAYAKMKSSYSNPYSSGSSSSRGTAILAGIGIEHFVNDNFAVNVGALSGYWTSSPDDSDASFSFTSISSQLVDFSLVWYLK